MNRNVRGSIASAMCFALGVSLLLVASADSCLAQALPPVRGVYTPGFNATNSGFKQKSGKGASVKVMKTNAILLGTLLDS